MPTHGAGQEGSVGWSGDYLVLFHTKPLPADADSRDKALALTQEPQLETSYVH